MNTPLLFGIVIVLSYLLGSFPTAYLVARKWAGKDVTQVGSGNIGTMNIHRATENKGLTALVLCGDQDLMTPLRFSQYLARNLPNATLEVIHDAGHMVILERPREVAERLLAFIDQFI